MPRNVIDAATVQLAVEFMELFSGLKRAYGCFKIDMRSQLTSQADGAKLEGKASTVMRELTVREWQKHILGETGIGVVPIDENAKVRWGAIDVDNFHTDLPDLSRKLASSPIIVCRSKSGGAHLFMFAKEPVPAQLMQAKLRAVAGLLGFGGSEIFPKQIALKLEQGDVGNWLNMPYFAGDETIRYALIDGQKVGMLRFLAEAGARQLSESQLQSFSPASVDKKTAGPGDDLPEGPPCLQVLVKLGFPEGTRNNGLYNLGVYLKKKNPETWEKDLQAANKQHMNPPLTEREVMAVAKSLRRKDYFYKCSDMPICPHCDKPTCLTRRFGVGGDPAADFPTIGGLLKLETIPPVYFLDVADKRLGPLEAPDLLQQARFRRRCMEKINRIPPIIKSQQWDVMLQKLLNSLQVVEMPEEASAEGQLWQFLYHFCSGKSVSDRPEDLNIGKPYNDGQRIYFRLRDFMDYLERNRFKDFRVQEVAAHLRSRGVEHSGKRINGTFLNVWALNAPRPESDVPVPEIERDAF